jgi:hypothetical protein
MGYPIASNNSLFLCLQRFLFFHQACFYTESSRRRSPPQASLLREYLKVLYLPGSLDLICFLDIINSLEFRWRCTGAKIIRECSSLIILAFSPLFAKLGCSRRHLASASGQRVRPSKGTAFRGNVG